MTHVMCNTWKKTFILAALTPLTMISPICDFFELIIVLSRQRNSFIEYAR
jgi:hypothetical protein